MGTETHPMNRTLWTETENKSGMYLSQVVLHYYTAMSNLAVILRLMRKNTTKLKNQQSQWKSVIEMQETNNDLNSVTET